MGHLILHRYNTWELAPHQTQTPLKVTLTVSSGPLEPCQRTLVFAPRKGRPLTKYHKMSQCRLQPLHLLHLAFIGKLFRLQHLHLCRIKDSSLLRCAAEGNLTSQRGLPHSSLLAPSNDRRQGFVHQSDARNCCKRCKESSSSTG